MDISTFGKLVIGSVKQVHYTTDNSQLTFDKFGGASVTKHMTLIAMMLLATLPATAQTKKWRTPCGEPDLQGPWSNATTTPLERPAKYEGREFLTKEERAEQDKETAIGRDKRGEPGSKEDVDGAYNAFWWERGWSDGRTSLIFDPPDGRIPPLTEDGRRRQSARNESARTEGPYDGPEDLDLYTRCLLRGPVPRIPSGYNNNYQIVQSKGLVVILQEQ